MRVIAGMVSVALLASGCGSVAKRTAPRALLVGVGGSSLAAAGFLGFLALLAPSGGCGETREGCSNAGLGPPAAILIIVGVTALVVAMATKPNTGPDKATRGSDEAFAHRMRADDEARIDQVVAHQAALRNDCEKVKRLSTHAFALDPVFHHVVFDGDEAIKRCLTTPSAVHTEPPALPPPTEPLALPPPTEPLALPPPTEPLAPPP